MLVGAGGWCGSDRKGAAQSRPRMRPPPRKLRVESLPSLRARILVNDNSVSKPKARITSASRSEAWAGLATLVGTALDLRNSDEAKGFQALIRIAEWTGRGCGE